MNDEWQTVSILATRSLLMLISVLINDKRDGKSVGVSRIFIVRKQSAENRCVHVRG